MSLETFHHLPPYKQKTIIDKSIELFSKASFADVSTDLITQEAGISKGLLFHYFGSKKNFYLYLLEYAIKLLTENGDPETFENKGFYEILFEICFKRGKQTSCKRKAGNYGEVHDCGTERLLKGSF